MTCIAFDGKTLAGDRLASYGGTRIHARKVYRIRDTHGKEWLVGGSGQRALLTHWRLWLQGKADKPHFDHDAEFTGLMIDRSHRIWMVEHNLTPMRVPAKYFAVGRGRGEALGAMAMGADARKAVRIAQQYDDSCGGGVDAVSFGAK